MLADGIRRSPIYTALQFRSGESEVRAQSVSSIIMLRAQR